MSTERLDSIRKRVRDHQARQQQLEGRKQSLQEQRTRYVDELGKAGLTPEQLPSQIEQLEQQHEAQVSELEATLTAAGA